MQLRIFIASLLNRRQTEGKDGLQSMPRCEGGNQKVKGGLEGMSI